ncbi:YoaK family protein [Arthrobacter luteolus]|uniref:YoaK family protein n=1 Tax=Arthrobacter luteolus TaxID=98672 RepID=UPI00082A064B|nr:YoaK family protein [Arthrobacter luteolus]
MRRLNAVPTERFHLWLMLASTFSTGVIDALGYLGLDQVFTGNMTGNVLLLGMAFAGGADLPTLRPALALVCFMLGAALAGRVLRRGAEGWSAQVSVSLGVVAGWIALLAVFTALVDVQTVDVLGSVTTSSMAAAMGIQAATARHLKVAEISTVVVTSTITGLASDSRLAGGNGHFWARRVLAISLILMGAVAGAALLNVGLWLGFTVSALISTTVAVLGSVRYHRDRRPAVEV